MILCCWLLKIESLSDCVLFVDLTFFSYCWHFSCVIIGNYQIDFFLFGFGSGCEGVSASWLAIGGSFICPFSSAFRISKILNFDLFARLVIHGNVLFGDCIYFVCFFFFFGIIMVSSSHFAANFVLIGGGVSAHYW